MSEAAAILTLKPHDIEIGERIGFYWPEKAEALSKLLAKDGQNDPIKVRRNGNAAAVPWKLVAGHHRLCAALMAGIDVKAIEVKGDNTELRKIEASENMHRRDFGPLEKAKFVRAIADIYENACPSDTMSEEHARVAARARWDKVKRNVSARPDEIAEAEAEHSAATIAGLYGWQEDAAEELGMSARRMRDYLLIYRQVIAPWPEMTHSLARHPIGKVRKSVMEIAAIAGEDARYDVINMLTSLHGRDMKSVADVLETLGHKNRKAPAASGQSKFTNNATANLDRMTPTSWKSFVPVIAERCPKDALFDLRDAVLARIENMEDEGNG